MVEKKKERVIWCDTIPFWHLVAGAVGMKVKGVWGLGTQWKHQCARWWDETSWIYGGRGTHLEGWEAGWVLTE